MPEAEIATSVLANELEGLTETTTGMFSTPLSWWTTRDHIIPASLLEDVDENVLALMPDGTEISDIEVSGSGNWSRSAIIHTDLNGEEILYFIKVNDFRSGPTMITSEFESLKAMFKAVPGICVDPIGWGRYASNPNVYFLLCPFMELFNEPPDPATLPPKLAELHRNGVSPDGKYGFHVPVSGGPLALKLAKSASWEDYLVRYLRFFFQAEKIAQGERPSEMERLLKVLFERIIPRLIRPLETGGREITPRIVHTNLWSGNRAVNEDGDPVMFDPCAIYGHSELDLGVWALSREPFGPAFINSYYNHFEQSAPEEDNEGRNLLYTLAFEIRVSATLTGHDQVYRKECINYMNELDKRYPESYEDWAVSRGEATCPPKVQYKISWP